MKKIISVIVLFNCLIFSYGQQCDKKNLWLDYSLPMEERIEALVNEMTLDEKVSQLIDNSQAIPRLHVPKYHWWNECLHGVARAGRATVFPQAIGLGASFDEDLVYRVFSACSDEARAKYHEAVKNNFREKNMGLTVWSPNVNIFRDPRWGRGQETYGEDPYLTSRIGVASVTGLQGNHPKYLKVAACAKHFVVHSGPEVLRHKFNALVSQKDLWETYMPAFKALVKEAKVEGVMGAYNRTNGESCSASKYLLKDVLVDQWKFDGYIVSDCSAVKDVWKNHKLVETPEQAAALAVKVGLNLNCGTTFKNLKNAVKQGLVTEKEIDGVLSQLLKTRFRLGMFDPQEDCPFSNINPEVVGSEKHQKLALEAGLKSLVLVKNNNVLPLKKNIQSLYVTGPQASNVDALIGNYYGLSGNMVTILEGISAEVGVSTKIVYSYGQLPYSKNINSLDWTTGVAKKTDACIAVMGYNNLWEGEEGESLSSPNRGDLKDCRLPKAQIDFLKKLKKGNSKPLIVVLTGGSPIIIPEIYEIADAIIYAFYSGEQGGNAVADVIFGNVSPSGRLPFTIPYAVDDLPPFEDYSMKGRTYRYMEKEPLFPFGFGLSYSTLEYSDISSQVIGDKVLVVAQIQNQGQYELEEVVQLYISSPLAGKKDPIYSLQAFKRVHLQSGVSKKVTFTLSRDNFLQVNDQGKKYLPKGDFSIFVGGSLPGERSEKLGASNVLKQVVNSECLPRLQEQLLEELN